MLILLPSGLDFAVAFLGSLYAGAVAVPCSTGPRNRGAERIAVIAADAGAAVAIGDASVDELLGDLAKLGVRPLRIDRIDGDPQSPVAAPDLNSPALLQYTSGSTSTPKGVIVTHHNLISHLETFAVSHGVSDGTVYLNWLPLFHDMGLIGNLLSAIYHGVPCVVMPPLSVYQRPQRWLSAVSRYGATISGGPNFAYELCVRRFPRMDLTGIDLSRWELAFCGAELVRPETLRRFADLFAAVGFRADALYPCYGLAEATLFVSGARRPEGLRTHLNESGLEVVSCGRAGPGERLLIVDPDTETAAPEGRTGEIWVGGDHVAAGYWKRPQETAHTFGARLRPTGEGPFLRTGDLGWMRDGELYFACRMKDLMVCRGANIHPEDIETTVAASHPALGAVNAAFSVESSNEEQVVVVQELARRPPSDFDPIAALAAISEAVAGVHGLRLYDAVLVRAGAVPRTTSGKVQRRRCGDLYREGALDAVAALRRLSAR